MSVSAIIFIHLHTIRHIPWGRSYCIIYPPNTVYYKHLPIWKILHSSIPGRGRDCFLPTMLRLALELTHSPVKQVLVDLTSRTNFLMQSPHSNIEVQNVWSFTVTPAHRYFTVYHKTHSCDWTSTGGHEVYEHHTQKCYNTLPWADLPQLRCCYSTDSSSYLSTSQQFPVLV